MLTNGLEKGLYKVQYSDTTDIQLWKKSMVTCIIKLILQILDICNTVTVLMIEFLVVRRTIHCKASGSPLKLGGRWTTISVKA